MIQVVTNNSIYIIEKLAEEFELIQKTEQMIKQKKLEIMNKLKHLQLSGGKIGQKERKSLIRVRSGSCAFYALCPPWGGIPQTPL
jgi:hypothetical protein